MNDADLVLYNIGQLVTCSSFGKAKRGREMSDIGLIKDAAIVIKDGTIVRVGPSEEILQQFSVENVIDAAGDVVCPGFVDPHTHIVFAGDRLDEFEQKINGSEYLEILAAGGGIISTVRQTRAASVEDIVQQSQNRLEKMLACGTMTVEIKTGYGLETETELKMLDAIERLARIATADIVPTFMPAHAVPPEFKDNANAYVDLICREMLQRAWKWYVASGFHGRTPFFCDVFCEKGAFSLGQSKQILESAKSLGFKIKAHVDEFTNLGGSGLAIGMEATSIDHLDAISAAEVAMLASSQTIAVATPTVNFNLGSTQFADIRKLIDSGCAVALSTDYNPGSAPCPSQAFTMAMSCRYQHISPAEAFSAVTINAAHAVGLGSRVGSIERGKQADLVIFNTRDYRQIAHEFGGNLVKTLIKKGNVVNHC